VTLGSIGELPFRRREPLELLALDDETRAEVAHDYAGYGWAQVDRLRLDGEDGALVDDALVLALHSPDDAEDVGDDVELEFELADGGAVTVLLSAFLARWLPPLRGDERAIVLALCNPHDAPLRLHADVPIWYASGDVTSWLDADGVIRLHAPRWHVTSRERP